MAPDSDDRQSETARRGEGTPKNKHSPASPGGPVTHRKGKNSKEPLVHPQAVLKGKVELAEGCCVGVASLLDGGESGIIIDKSTVVEDRVTIVNR